MFCYFRVDEYKYQSDTLNIHMSVREKKLQVPEQEHLFFLALEVLRVSYYPWQPSANPYGGVLWSGSPQY